MNKFTLSLILTALLFCGGNTSYSSDKKGNVDQVAANTSSLVNLTEILSARIKKPIILPHPSQFNDKIVVIGQFKRNLDIDLYKKILRQNGYVLFEYDQAIRVLPQVWGKVSAPTVTEGSSQSFGDDDYVLAMVSVSHVDPASMLRSLRTMVPTAGHFVAHETKNVLVVVDFWDNIKNIKNLVKLLDTPLSGPEKQRNKKAQKD